MNTQSKSNWNFRFLLSLGASAALAMPLMGCDTGGAAGPGPDGNWTPGDNVGDDDDDNNNVAGTSFHGVVRDSMGLPITGVAITTSAGHSAMTDQSGRFAIEDIDTDGEVQVHFKKDGFARSHVPFQIVQDAENFLLQTMAEVDLVRTFDSSEAQNLAIEHEGQTLSIDLPGSNFIDESGAAYSGEVTVEATFFDLTSPMDEGLEVFAAPGDFGAVDSQGEDQRLESFGMIQVNLMGADDQELNLGTAGAPMLVPIQDLGSMPVAGETVPAWSYDVESGDWIEEGAGEVVDIDGELFWEFTASHFSTWNVDKPIATHGCLSGQVTTAMGEPRKGATVRAVGQTYISTTTARTDDEGNFCLEVKNGETVWVEVSYSIGGQPATQRTDPVTIPAGQATCADGETTDCVDLGVIPVDIMSCVAGVVIDGQNQPVAGADVVSPQGGIATSDEFGAFCVAVPVFQATNVFVQTSLDEVGYQPVQVYTQPGTPDCQAGCPNPVILRPFAETTCAEGNVIVNGQAAGNMPVQVFDAAFPEVAVYTTLSQDDGSYCAQVPVLTEVAVSVGSGDEACGHEVINTEGLGGEFCDESSQSSCKVVPDFVCEM